jgi:hypothetical protein
MSLLTTAQIAAIRSEIKQVTDTFFVTPVAYFRASTSLDVYQEDRADRFEAAINMLGMVEYPTATKVMEESGGALDRAAIMVTLNVDDLSEYLVEETGQLDFQPLRDEISVNGERFRITHWKYDGPLERKNVLWVLFADRKVKNA